MEKSRRSKKTGHKLIGEQLVLAGIITPKQLKQALKMQAKGPIGARERLGEILLKSGFIDEKTLVDFLEKRFGIPRARLGPSENLDPAIVRLIPERVARTMKVIAVSLDTASKKLVVAMNDPFDIVALDTIKIKTGYDVIRRFSFAKVIDEAIDRYYGATGLQKSIQEFIDKKTSEDGGVKRQDLYRPAKAIEERLEMSAGDAPVIDFVDRLFINAVQEGASDIHIEPQEDKLSIRYRIDGILQERFPPPKEMQAAIITRLKLLGDMNLAEQRLPQDGRFTFRIQNRDIDLRMASIPTIYGEKLVLRILDSTSLLLKMDDLGISKTDIDEFKKILAQSYGFILVSGPTGSGKTTTLYSALNYINSPSKNIVTIEDPVEYHLKGINQIQTKHQIGLTFASGLRTVLRQDPDMIMIGEIRDLETLENAVKASLTGHLVLSTIHTNDAPSVVLRLVHMGLEPYLIASCLSLVIAQRLIRKICPNCKERLKLSSQALSELEKTVNMNLGRAAFYKGKGCDICRHTGYKGRTGLYEFLLITKRIKDAILEGINDPLLRKISREEGMKTIFERGLEKVNEGITTIEEVLRVTVLEKIG